MSGDQPLFTCPPNLGPTPHTLASKQQRESKLPLLALWRASAIPNGAHARRAGQVDLELGEEMGGGKLTLPPAAQLASTYVSTVDPLAWPTWPLTASRRGLVPGLSRVVPPGGSLSSSNPSIENSCACEGCKPELNTVLNVSDAPIHCIKTFTIHPLQPCFRRRLPKDGSMPSSLGEGVPIYFAEPAYELSCGSQVGRSFFVLNGFFQCLPTGTGL